MLRCADNVQKDYHLGAEVEHWYAGCREGRGEEPCPGTAGGKLDERLDNADNSNASTFGESKANDYTPAVGAEHQNDAHEAAASKQP